MTLAIFLFISIVLVIIQTAIPFLVKRTIIFGITVPEKHIEDEKLLSYKKSYILLVSLLSLVVLSGYVLWALVSNPSEEQTVLIGTFIQFGIILFSLSLYFFFHGKTFQLKKAHKWMENLKQVKVKVGRSDKHNVVEVEEEITDYDEDSHWKGGLFYFNRNDPSIFVEKRFGVGWTLNFGNPIGYLIFLVPLVVILVFSL
jgi:uncharacterized membrane protein